MRNWTLIIYLNGVRQQDCLVCDDEQGFVLRQARDGRGRLTLERGKARTVKLHGKVEFEIRDERGALVLNGRKNGQGDEDQGKSASI